MSPSTPMAAHDFLAFRVLQPDQSARSSPAVPAQPAASNRPARKASIPHGRRDRGTRHEAPRGRPVRRHRHTSRSEVMDSASSGGKSAARQSDVDAQPDHEVRVGRAQALASRRARRPSLRGSMPSRSTTRSLGHFRATVPSGSPAMASAASAIASDAVAITRQARSGWIQVGRNPRESSSAASRWREPCPPGSSTAGRLLVGDRDADLGLARLEPGPDDVVRRADPLERCSCARGRTPVIVSAATLAGAAVSRPLQRRRLVPVVRARRPRAGRGAPSPGPPRRSCR